MAKPTNAINCGAYYLRVTAQTWIYFVHKIPRMPAEWNTDNIAGEMPTQAVRAQLYITCDNTDTINVNAYLAKAGVLTDTESTTNDVSTYQWQDEITTTERPVGQVSFHYPTDPKQEYSVVECGLNLDEYDGTTIARISGFRVRCKWDVETYSEQVKQLEHNTAADRVYVPDYPVSAWHVKDVIVNSLNTFLYHGLPHYSVPVFGLDAGD